MRPANRTDVEREAPAWRCPCSGDDIPDPDRCYLKRIVRGWMIRIGYLIQIFPRVGAKDQRPHWRTQGGEDVYYGV